MRELPGNAHHKAPKSTWFTGRMGKKDDSTAVVAGKCRIFGVEHPVFDVLPMRMHCCSACQDTRSLRCGYSPVGTYLHTRHLIGYVPKIGKGIYHVFACV